MKKLFVLIVLATIFLVVMGNMLQAQTAVTQWGSTPRGTSDWTVLNTASTPAGNASMGGTAAPTAWMSIKGGFAPMTPTTSQAFVITGTFEFVGGGNGAAYTWLRFALFNEAGTLTGQNTPTAAWSEDANAYGYEFDPRSGAGTIANGSGGGVGEQGTEWYINNSKSWTSTNSNGGRAISTVLQAPYNQVATAGVYDWAISVQPLATGGSQVNWYFIQQHAASSTNYYWWGGSFVDPTPVTTSFNSIGFGVNGSGVDATMKQVNLTNVKVSLGSPITVPTAPFQSFYVDAWGGTPRGTQDWTILNDSTYLIGDASMGGTAAPSNWMTIKGGFREKDSTLKTVKPTVDKALVITGTFEFVGGGNGSAYTWLRYALFNERGTLTGRNTPAAAWSEDTVAWGYEFDPRSGAGTIANGSGGGVGEQGTEWYVVNSKSWTSTNSNGGRAISTVLQAPSNQVASAGVYDWAISVQPLATGGSEVRWYFIQQHTAGTSNYYWWGGSFIDPTPVATGFNSIGFGVNGSGVDATMKRVNIRNVKVDLTTPITVPTAPWQAYYVKDWGFIGGRMYGWTFTQGDVVGNATISGTKANDKWAAIRGGFEALAPTAAKAMVLTGSVEFVGGGLFNPGTFRFGTFYSDQAGKVILDTAKATLPDSTRWDGTEFNTNGYLFVPPISTTGLYNWAGVNQGASSGGVINGAWLHTDYPATGWTTNYTLGTDVQTPANSPFPAGVYDFTITAYAKSTTSNDVRWKLAKQGGGYSITGKLTDSHMPLAATKFNSINFAISGDSPVTGLKLTNVKVDYVDVASVPIASIVGVTSVEGASSTAPTTFAMEQNYPNPFNPSTTIRYDVAKPAYVTIRVYDVLGRMVSQLVDGVHAASSYVVRWNPSGLSSGTYLYRIDARNVDGSGSFSSVKKLILMK